MYKAHKAYADAAKARFAKNRAKMKPRMGRVSLRPNFPTGTKGFPANASHFGAAASSNSVGLLSKSVLKRLLIGHLGVTNVTANGIDIITGLIDKGVDEALELCKDIHLTAVRNGASNKTFGTDTHVEVARNHPTAALRLNSLPFPDAVLQKRNRNAEASRARFEALPDYKKEKKMKHSYIPAITKTIFTKLSKASVLNGLPKPKMKESSPASLINALAGRPGGIALIEKFFGENTADVLRQINVPFTDDDGDTFFPGYSILAAASHDKWINYETVAMLITAFGQYATSAISRDLNESMHYGFYKQWKLVKKDVDAYRNNTITPLRKSTMIRAVIKGYALYQIVGGDKHGNLNGAYASLVNDNYFNTVAREMNASNNGTSIARESNVNTLFMSFLDSTVALEKSFH